jgi:hypothetical protein
MMEFFFNINTLILDVKEGEQSLDAAQLKIAVAELAFIVNYVIL